MDETPSDLALAVAERRRAIYAAHLRGLSHDEIARELAVPGGAEAVRADVTAVNRRLRSEAYGDIGDMRATELARLDLLMQKALEVAEGEIRVVADDVEMDDVDAKVSTRLAAIRTALQVMERRAKLAGLDAPTRSATEVAVVRYDIPGVEPEALR